MALAGDIEQCKANALAALQLNHDFYAHTKLAWRFLQHDVERGRTFSFRNLVTDVTVDQETLRSKSQLYVTHHLASSTFQQFVTIFEEFLFDIMGRWLLEHPNSLNKRMLEFEVVVRSSGKEEITKSVVGEELNKLKYERISAWFKYLDRLVHLGCPSSDEIELLAEIKASRDIIVHNRFVVNDTYASKSGTRARYQVGDRLEIPERYHQESWQLICKIITDLSAAVVAKAK